MRGTGPVGLLACALGLWLARAPGARAEEDPKRICAAAYTSGQRLMRAGSLIEAGRQLAQCGGPRCPAAMQSDCQQWLAEVENSTPTVVFQVSATAGPPPRNVLLSVDGAAPIALDARAIAIDPGTHDLMLTAPGYRDVTLRVVVSEGEKLRREAVVFPLADASLTAPPLAPSPPKASRFTVPVIVSASVAGLAAVSAVYFGIQARADDRALDRCADTCSKETVDTVRREYLLTNVSIGVAAAGLTTAAVLYLLHRSTEPAPAATVSIAVGPAGIGPVLIGRF